MNKKNVLVAQSGGPTSAINASLAGVLKATIDSEQYDRCYGSINGIMGVLSENYLDLTDKASGIPDFINLLTHTPAMYLGSCRFKLPDFKDDDSSYSFIFSQFKKLNIGA
ncbi:MAG: 6-phosphofructokinase, partial [Butyrivibrio sp.]|nr:6-phosphofructokinase [Butyrivibrio sp.]